MSRRTRRRFLASVASAGAAALAGCNGLLGDGGGSGTDSPTWAEWIPADLVVDDPDVVGGYVDVGRYREEFPESAQSGAGFRRYEELLGLSEGGLDLYVQVERGDETEHAVVTGDIDAETVTQRVGVDPSESYRGYDVLGNGVAITDGVLIGSAEFRRIVDAREGDVQSLEAAAQPWSDAVDDASDGAVGSVEATVDQPWEATAIEVEGTDGTDLSVVVYAHFASESAAADNTDAVERAIQQNTDDFQEITVQNVRVEGAVVVVEAVSSEYSL